MANMIQGQIQVGPSHQARLPPLQDTPVELCESREELVWKPGTIADVDLLMYLRAARSMAAFVGWCDGGSTDDGCAAASMDETTISSLQLLHDNTYDTGRALQALVKVINPKSADRRWSDDDAKRFVKGLKQHGKNFFKIRRDLLPAKNTAQLVEYYYLWKKSATASTTRPHRRHRRPVLRRQAPTPTPPSSESVEERSLPSEGSENEMESDEGCDHRRVVVREFVCMRCQTTESTVWYRRGGKRSGTVCAACKPVCSEVIGEIVTEPPPFMFRPVKEDEHPADGERNLESASSMDASPETSDEGNVGSGERASPSLSCTRSSSSAGSTGASASDKELSNIEIQPQPKCLSPVAGVVMKSEEIATEGALPCVPPLHKVSDPPVMGFSAENWHCLDGIHAEEKQMCDRKDVMTNADCTPPTLQGDYPSGSESVIKKEPVGACEPEAGDAACVKMEDVNSSRHLDSPSLASQWSENKSARAVASIAPCTVPHSTISSPWKCSPPPLLHSMPHTPDESASAAGAAIPPVPFDVDEASRVSNEESEQSDIESRIQAPSPEPRVINEDFHRSKSAIFVRRWFRGLTTCARTDVEFLPPPDTPLAIKREAAKARSASKMQLSSGSKDSRRSEPRSDDKKKPRTPPENRDAQITSTLMSSYGMDLPPGLPRAPMYNQLGQSATPALQKLSEYIRPHAAGAASEGPRCMQYGPAAMPPQGMDPYFAMQPGAYLPGAWEAIEREMVKEKREREAYEREMREIEFVEKMRQELTAQGLDRLVPPGTPYWEELQRMYGPLALNGLPPGLAANIPGFFPQQGISMEFIQRERERIEALRLNQEQQQQLAAAMAAAGNRDNAAAAAMLQRHLLAMSSPKDQELARMMDASSLIYHFARADPLAGSGSSSSAQPPSTPLPPGMQPHFQPGPPVPQDHPLIAMAHNYDRMCMDLLSRPPYNTDPVLQHQLMMQLSAQGESLRHQIAALEREGIAPPQLPPPSLR